MTTTSSYAPLLSMVFKIKFLKTVLGIMGENDVIAFYEILTRISSGTAQEIDFKKLDLLYELFEAKNAVKISKT